MEETARRAAEGFRLLGDPTRIRLLAELLDGEKCVYELAKLIGASQSLVSHHLHILRVAGIVRGERRGKEVHYSLADGHIAELLRMGIEHAEE